MIIEVAYVALSLLIKRSSACAPVRSFVCVIVYEILFRSLIAKVRGAFGVICCFGVDVE